MLFYIIIIIENSYNNNNNNNVKNKASLTKGLVAQWLTYQRLSGSVAQCKKKKKKMEMWLT